MMFAMFDDEMKSRLRDWRLWVLLLALGGVFSLAVTHLYFWDDEYLFRDSIVVTEAAWKAPFYDIMPSQVPPRYYRPAAIFPSAVVGNLFGTRNAVPFHLLHLLWSLTAVLLFYTLLSRFFKRGPALAMTAVFAVFPANVESFAWLSSVGDVAAFCFSMVFLIGYLDERERSFPRWTTALAFALTFFSKETAVALFPLVFFLDWRRLRLEPRKVLLYWGTLVGIFAFYMAARSFVVQGTPPFIGRIGLSLETLGAYASKLAYPWPLSILVEPLPDAISWRAWLGGVIVLALGAILIRGQDDRVRLGAALLAASVLPCLNLWLPFGEEYLVAERYMLPMVAGALILGGALLSTWGARPTIAVCFILSLVYLPGTVARFGHWRTPEMLWRTAADAYPAFVQPHLRLAMLAAEKEEFAEAISSVKTALAAPALRNKKPGAGLALSMHEVAQNVYSGAGKYDEALVHARAAFALRPSPARVVEGMRLHESRLDYDAVLSAGMKGTRAFPAAAELVQTAYKVARMGDRRKEFKEIQALARTNLVDVAARTELEVQSIAGKSHFERGTFFAQRGFLSLGFREFARAATEMTALEAGSVAEFALERHLWSSALQYSELAAQKGSDSPRLEVIRAAVQKSRLY